MKYEYLDKKANEVIRNYETKENKIVINLLNGDTYEIPLSKENEKKILNELLKQAEERNKFADEIIDKAKSKKDKALVGIIWISFLMLFIL